MAFRGPKAAPALCAALALAPPAASPASACPRPSALALRVSLLPLQCRRCCRCCSKRCVLPRIRLLLPPPPLSLPLRRGGCSRGGYHCLQAAQCRRRPPCRCGHAFLSEQRCCCCCCCCCAAAAAAEEAPCSAAQQPRQQLAAAGACRRPLLAGAWRLVRAASGATVHSSRWSPLLKTSFASCSARAPALLSLCRCLRQGIARIRFQARKTILNLLTTKHAPSGARGWRLRARRRRPATRPARRAARACRRGETEETDAQDLKR